MDDPALERELDEIAHPSRAEIDAMRKVEDGKLFNQAWYVIGAVVGLVAFCGFWLMSLL